MTKIYVLGFLIAVLTSISVFAAGLSDINCINNCHEQNSPSAGPLDGGADLKICENLKCVLRCRLMPSDRTETARVYQDQCNSRATASEN